VQEPIIRVADFEVRTAKLVADHHAVFELRDPALALDVTVHYQLDGRTRRKWVEAKNRAGRELLLLDVELDDFTTEAPPPVADKDSRCSEATLLRAKRLKSRLALRTSRCSFRLRNRPGFS
jgi:hypothetical protein